MVKCLDGFDVKTYETKPSKFALQRVEQVVDDHIVTPSGLKRIDSICCISHQPIRAKAILEKRFFQFGEFRVGFESQKWLRDSDRKLTDIAKIRQRRSELRAGHKVRQSFNSPTGQILKETSGTTIDDLVNTCKKWGVSKDDFLFWLANMFPFQAEKIEPIYNQISKHLI